MGAAVTSITTYAAPVWASKMAPSHWAPLESVNRGLALRIASAYRTVSKEAALVVAGLPPARLQARKACLLAEGLPRGEVEEQVITEWQAEWAAATKGAWTRRLIPEVGPWLGRRHGEVDFYLTQLLTGHGNMGSYLHRFKLANDATCGS